MNKSPVAPGVAAAAQAVRSGYTALLDKPAVAPDRRTRTVDPGAHPHYDLLLQSGQVTRVYLDEWAQPRQTLTQQVMSVVLAEPQHALREARMVLTQVGSAAVVDTRLAATIVNLVETLLVYKLPTLSWEGIQAMLELTDIDLKQTRFYQDVFTEGRQAGEQAGWQKGRQEGRQEGEVTLILRLLQRRCGEVAPAMQEQIRRLPLPQLEALGEALLEFGGAADLEQWLTTHGQEGEA